MSISNYTELQTAVATWLNRTDLTTVIPDFISLAETRINRSLRARGMETRYTVAMVSGTEYYTLPTTFLEARNVQINTNPVNVLTYSTPEQLDTEYPNSATGVPQSYSIIGTEIQLKPIPGTTDELEIAYYSRPLPLSNANLTNWTMTNAPDLMLYGSLIEAEAYLVNDKRIAIWKSLFEQSLNELNAQEMRGRFSGSHLSVRSGSSTP